MGFLDRAREGSGYVEKSSSAGVPSSGLLPTLGSMSSAAGVTISQATAITVSTVYACVMARALDFARCTPRILSIKDGRSGEPNTAHAAAKIMKRPNWVQTWFEFAVQMEAAYVLRNNAYAIILRDGRGVPQYMLPVNPDNVQVLEAADGEIFYQVNRQGLFQMWALGQLPLAIPAEDVFHLRGLTFNMLVGISTIGIARDAIGLAMGLEQQASRFVANGARPGGVLESAKKISADTAKRLREQWDSLRSGIQNVGRTAILEDGLQWKPMQLTSVELEFIAQRKMSVEDVARYMRVPLYRIGVTGELGKAKPEDLDTSYVNTVIMPDVEAWEQKFEQMFDLEKDGLQADLDERNLLRASESTRINNQRLAIMSGLETQNEARKDNGRPAKKGGDELLRPVNLAASGSDMSGTAPDGAGRPTSGTLPDPGAANSSEGEVE
ncbi:MULTISPECIES: phage portal protein [unclassified Rhizobium]|uniref:phage portal protein n=1 Tax=unclassified Rhizobium TaxID=2613769 RepID=UPI00161D07B1|nr:MULTISPECIES: phage portal protein [unclassified Rhizobium]MBB3297888.1 HK97 family phage portal protein [Rhizobium sp. BK112]MBB4177617.1 HK97 family phage portal protein [Rhizobium sp. BK109]